MEGNRCVLIPWKLVKTGVTVVSPDSRISLNFVKALRPIPGQNVGGANLTTSQYVKYPEVVIVVTEKHLMEAMGTYKDAAEEIKAWRAIVKGARWHSFPEVRAIFKDADPVNDYVIFNIRHNRYRLVTVIHYAKATKEKQTQGHVYIRSFLTHKEYDNPANWDRKYGTRTK